MESLGLVDVAVENSPHVNDLQLMTEVPLGEATRSHVIALFSESEVQSATNILVEKCGRNLPLMGDKNADVIERIRIAALKVSGGDLDALRRAIHLANVEWRDLLVEAGFAHDVKAHLHWRPD